MTTLDPSLRVFHHPRGRIAEAYRAVRTALYFSTRGGRHKVVQVTSPNPGDGKKWIDADFKDGMEITKVAFDSDAYWALLGEHKKLSKYQSIGIAMLVVLNGKAYEIGM